MAYVSESDMSIARALRQGIRSGKGNKWARRLVLLSIPLFFLYWFLQFMRTSGEGDMGTGALLALLFTGFYLLWLVFLLACIVSIRSMLGLGTRGKACLVASLALTVAVFVWFGSVTSPFAGRVFFVAFSPFVMTVAIEVVMLVSGFFSRSSLDGDEELAQSVDKAAAKGGEVQGDKDAK